MFFPTGKTTYPWLNPLRAPCDQCSSGHRNPWCGGECPLGSVVLLPSKFLFSPQVFPDSFPGSGRRQGPKRLVQHSGHVKLEGGFSVPSETHLLVSAAPRSRFYKLSGQGREGPPCFSYLDSPTLLAWWAAFTLKSENIPAPAR